MTARCSAALALLFGGLSAPGLARAADGDCFGVDPLSQGDDIVLATVVPGGPNVAFIDNPRKSGPACPSLDPACRKKAFVVSGDAVLAVRGKGDFLCSTFKSPKGAETNGWLPAAALKVATAATPTLGDWAGTWTRDREGRIVLTVKGPALEVAGEATYGALDPGRVRRGAVNVGQLEGVRTPRGATLALGEGYDGGKPPPESPDYACLARLRLMPPYLVAEDNGSCGGMNVRFSGIYVRGRR